MKKTLIIGVVLAASVSASTAMSSDFTLSSPDIGEGQKLTSKQVFQGFGCEGGNTAPTLTWSGVPEGTKSFAITAYDPDAPTGSGWWHWFAFNIPANVTNISPDKKLSDDTTELTNDYGSTGFGGACPPEGKVHRYVFTVHALNTKLDLDENVSNALAGYMVNANSIAKTSITAVYNR